MSSCDDDLCCHQAGCPQHDPDPDARDVWQDHAGGVCDGPGFCGYCDEFNPVDEPEPGLDCSNPECSCHDPEPVRRPIETVYAIGGLL